MEENKNLNFIAKKLNTITKLNENHDEICNLVWSWFSKFLSEFYMLIELLITRLYTEFINLFLKANKSLHR